jgi:density-regulated protein DRP1
MTDFVKEAGGEGSSSTIIDFDSPTEVKYSPISGLPAEYCEFSATFEKELPWLKENAPEVLSEDQLAKAMGEVSLQDDDGKIAGDGRGSEGADAPGKKKKDKNKIGAKIANKADEEQKTQVVIARIQRQKRKFVTAVAGLDTIPGLKIKDAAKLFGKKFASGAAVSESATGAKEVVIQGDVNFDLVPLIIKEYKVHPRDIFFLEDGKLIPQA